MEASALAESESLANSFFGWGMALQVLYGGISSASSVRDKLHQAQRLCDQSASLGRESEYLTQALVESIADASQVGLLSDLLDTWNGTQDDLLNQAIQQRKLYVKRFTYYLVFLAIFTLLLFLALEKKAGRLDKLFRKIDRIDAATASA